MVVRFTGCFSGNDSLVTFCVSIISGQITNLEDWQELLFELYNIGRVVLTVLTVGVVCPLWPMEIKKVNINYISTFTMCNISTIYNEGDTYFRSNMRIILKTVIEFILLLYLRSMNILSMRCVWSLTCQYMNELHHLLRAIKV